MAATPQHLDLQAVSVNKHSKIKIIAQMGELVERCVVERGKHILEKTSVTVKIWIIHQPKFHPLHIPLFILHLQPTTIFQYF